MSEEYEPESGKERGETEVEVVVVAEETGIGADRGARTLSGTGPEAKSIETGVVVAILCEVVAEDDLKFEEKKSGCR